MLDTIYISENLPNHIKTMLVNKLGTVFAITHKESASIYVLNEEDNLSTDKFKIFYIPHSKDIKRNENSDYFQPYKHNENTDDFSIELFLNLIEYHCTRLKLSPVVLSNFETIFACD